ncbi:hypothetical protein DLAC_10164 [Tieghemostelium lacteum]|uniref:N-acetyltransferase domain-containing protein n=1 Tax=Tieghemostelium lacteum TaxID=361077 RepID=A0A151Z6A4_TIELA|nr:hypothetical protein DLAC_10164 [Tieghemostelium lacteum]|eukprot:KYQ89489.1 hypothetical protein DLAC_10164 [Tieghemostelium lacteum]
MDIVIRPMNVDDVRTIYEVQKEMFPADHFYEEYAVFLNKFNLYPIGCWCIDRVMENDKNKSSLENNKDKLVAHIFTHPWFKDEFPQLNNSKALLEGIDSIVDKSRNYEIKNHLNRDNIVIYLNELGVRPIGRGYNLGRILTNHLFQVLDIKEFSLVSVQNSSGFWKSLGFELDQNPTEQRKQYLAKYYGEDACFMKNNTINKKIQFHSNLQQIKSLIMNIKSSKL